MQEEFTEQNLRDLLKDLCDKKIFNLSELLQHSDKEYILNILEKRIIAINSYNSDNKNHPNPLKCLLDNPNADIDILESLLDKGFKLPKTILLSENNYRMPIDGHFSFCEETLDNNIKNYKVFHYLIILGYRINCYRDGDGDIFRGCISRIELVLSDEYKDYPTQIKDLNDKILELRYSPDPGDLYLASKENFEEIQFANLLNNN